MFCGGTEPCFCTRRAAPFLHLFPEKCEHGKYGLCLLLKGGDKYATLATLRGTDWRGKDCDDLDRNVYPVPQLPIADATGPIYVGANWEGSYFDDTYAYDGPMDDVRLYDRALTPAEIQALAAQALP